MDHPRLPRLTMEEYVGAALNGATVFSLDDKKVGRIKHTYGTGQAAQVVIDAGDFLGIGHKPVLVSIGELDLRRNENGEVYATADWSEGDLKSMPTHEV